jgi:hypothetical protein
VSQEPIAGQFRHFFQSARFGEQMGGLGDDDDFMGAGEPASRFPIEFEHNFIAFADNQ